jgi:hypothetical protein
MWFGNEKRLWNGTKYLHNWKLLFSFERVYSKYVGTAFYSMKKETEYKETIMKHSVSFFLKVA